MSRKKFHEVHMGIMRGASVIALSLLVLLSPFCFEFCSGAGAGVADTITSTHFIKDPEIIVRYMVQKISRVRYDSAEL